MKHTQHGAHHDIDAMTLTAEQRRSVYDELGYLIFRNVFTPADIALLRSTTQQLVQAAAGLAVSNERYLVAALEDSPAHAVRRIYNTPSAHPLLQAATSDPRVLDLLADIIGPNIELHHGKINLKPRSREAQFDWHQDFAFFPHTNFDFIAVMLALDAATPENGCLTVIPGSHKRGPMQHIFAVDGAYSSRLADPSALGSEIDWVDLPMGAGDIELHHCNLLHSSRANRTDTARTAMVTHYRAADNMQLGGFQGHHGYGQVVRGEAPGRVRLQEGSYFLPTMAMRPPVAASSEGQP
ncbi:phytanoyl-CoA dioxygenase family protein [Massilia antarctica]|uniref:Phytanoyl-CoA dioxygenase family protein n=1 Tax=Massilia antarctica TaxID=2765360 RepID=A0AA48WBS1_9BURK|nr:phytanoyl-CoA dioxygenase family protein [Massilia antarctica]QPI48592.1 phytanoyl-CoA dioxygenase family protein [Massilia antarctica]